MTTVEYLEQEVRDEALKEQEQRAKTLIKKALENLENKFSAYEEAEREYNRVINLELADVYEHKSQSEVTGASTSYISYTSR